MVRILSVLALDGAKISIRLTHVVKVDKDFEDDFGRINGFYTRDFKQYS